MSEKSLESNVLKEVFRAMGKHFEWDTDVDVLIVGGAALALTSSLPPGRTTLDCDVMQYEPEDAEKAVEERLPRRPARPSACLTNGSTAMCSGTRPAYPTGGTIAAVRYCQKSCIARHDQAATFLIPSTNGTPEITSGIS